MSLTGNKISSRPLRLKFWMKGEGYFWDGTAFRVEEEDAKVVEAETLQKAIAKEFPGIAGEDRENLRWEVQ